MILYHIYTEDVNREQIERICLEELLFGTGFTIMEGTGHWGHCREKCVVIDVIGRDQDRNHVLRAASRIKTANKQEAVIVVETEAGHVWTIGKKNVPEECDE